MAIESAAEIKTRFAQLQKNIQQNPQHISSYRELATIFMHIGNHNQALQILSYALGISPGNAEICQHMTPLLSQIMPSAYHPELDRDIRECLLQELIDHQQLANLIAVHLLHKYQGGLAVNAALTTDAIFLRFLSRCINIHPQMESNLIALRTTLINQCTTKNVLPENETNLICSIALQAFANEYIWPISSVEEAFINRDYSAGKSTTTSLLLAMYNPLHQLIDQQEVAALKEMQNPLIRELIKTTVDEIVDEKQLIPAITALPSSNCDKISVQVRAQYELNPYPRWKTPPAPTPLHLKDYIQQLPGVQKKLNAEEPLHLLVAGCGTGFEPIDLARMDNTLNITALDLSKTSLAYGKRISNELSITNIQFIQGNILDAHKLNQQFDVINSTGVLHHMEDPEAGWRSLCAILKPGGIMRISLYSELARTRIVAARELIQQNGLRGELADIKKCRAMIFDANPEHPLHALIYSQDFYSTSGCRDLLFHVQEHRFTLLQIQSIIQQLGLTLVGFETPADAESKFMQEYPESLLDLEKWHHFETQYPDTFTGMYQFWLQKIQ